VTGRQLVYFSVRAVAAVAFVLGATVLPRGLPSALVCLAAGLAAVGSCLGVGAGGPGERAGARPQDRYFDSVTPPQGDWPPYQVGPSYDESPPGRPTDATRPAPPAS
jgi:hypothetical protein